jgi:hypothetical protein
MKRNETGNFGIEEVEIEVEELPELLLLQPARTPEK